MQLAQRIAKRHPKAPTLTRNYIPKSDSGHGNEAEVERVKEGPVLPDGEDQAADAQETCQECQGQHSIEQVGVDAASVIIIFIIIIVIFN